MRYRRSHGLSDSLAATIPTQLDIGRQVSNAPLELHVWPSVALVLIIIIIIIILYGVPKSS